MRTKSYYLGGDASKGYCDFVIVDSSKKTVESNFQLDDTIQGKLNFFLQISLVFT
jgi:hypothetical protein